MNPENLFGVGVGRMVGFPYLFSLQSAVLQEKWVLCRVDIIYAEGSVNRGTRSIRGHHLGFN
jgi:hypothetical protein